MSLTKFIFISVILPKNRIKLIHQKMSSFDGWPFTKWTKNHSWIETLKMLRNIGFGASYIFRAVVDKHPHNPSKMLLQVFIRIFSASIVDLEKIFPDCLDFFFDQLGFI